MLCISNYSTHGNTGHYKRWATGGIDLMGPVKGTVAAIEQYAPNNKKDMKIIIAEYAPFDWDPDGWGFNHDMGHTLCNFDMTGRQLLDDRVSFSCYWNTRWEEETVTTYSVLDKNNAFLPIAYSISLWANNLYPQMVEAVSSCNALVVFSSYDPVFNTAYIYVMNVTGKETTARFEVKGKKISKTEFVGGIKGKSPEDLDPVADTVVRSAGKKVSLPAYSVNVYRIYLKK
jgi:hypothetical protein